MTKHLLKNFHYKPLENYYETKYVSRLISDLLYTIMADALKDPVFDQPLSYVIKSTASTQSPTVAIVIYDIRQKKGG